MKKTILIAALALGTMLSVVPHGDAADAPPAPQINVTLHNEPVSGVSDREAFMATIVFPPGATTGRHVHPGDEFATVLEGELQLNVEGQPPRIVKAGDSYHNLQGVVHETKNLGTVPARTVATFVIEKGKPLVQPIK
jgi:quercetin dioxygenase-like cupin family protein